LLPHRLHWKLCPVHKEYHSQGILPQLQEWMAYLHLQQLQSIRLQPMLLRHLRQVRFVLHMAALHHKELSRFYGSYQHIQSLDRFRGIL
jgi:hypothetical protein